MARMMSRFVCVCLCIVWVLFLAGIGCASNAEFYGAGHAGPSSRASLSDAMFDVQVLNEKNQALEESVRTLENRISTLSTRNQDYSIQIENLTARVQSLTASIERLENLFRWRDIQTAISRGVALIKNNRYDDAYELLQPTLLQVNPEEEGHDQLLFLMAKALYGRGEYDRAALVAADVEVYHSESPLLPSTILIQGESFIQMKRPKDARIFFQDVVRRFPQSKEADAAKRRLAELESKKQ